MRFSFKKAVFAAVLAFNAASAFGTTIDVVFYDSRFGTYDDQTGVFTQLSTLPVAHSAGVASMNGLVYLEDMGTQLFTVDPVTAIGRWWETQTSRPRRAGLPAVTPDFSKSIIRRTSFPSIH